MEQVKTLKPGSVIKDISFSSSFYQRLSSLLMAMMELDEEYQPHLETLMILMATLDEAAENQGLTELKDVPI